MAISDSHWVSFLESANPDSIARQLRSDEDSCSRGFLPSTLVYHLPPSKSHRADAIALQLLPVNGRELVSRDLRRFLYESLRDKIKNEVEILDLLRSKRGDGETTTQSFCTSMVEQKELEKSILSGADNGRAMKDVAPLSASDLQTTRKVLRSLTASAKHRLSKSDKISKAICVIDTQLELIVDNQVQHPALPLADRQGHQEPQISGIPRAPDVSSRNIRTCYICMFQIKVGHESYPALCEQCGEFNLASSRISLPESFHLAGKVALVTGARVNLGFHTALRLLRCGARVIISSRYPRDAASRYSSEPDFEEWNHRLKILGSDFRTANDAFGLVNSVKEQLDLWKTNLHILINNAAQTLTDSIQKEENACQRESVLKSSPTQSDCLMSEHQYEPRIRGGGRPVVEASPIGAPDREMLEADAAHQRIEEAAGIKEFRSVTELGSVVKKSSWVQSLAEIPYEDFVSTFSINSLVPMILIRELLPQMASSVDLRVDSDPALPPVAVKPVSYIVNVSSREGIFELKPGHSHKRGSHLHTNMSKAALNMITETEAGRLWEHHRISMNTVDPGYMSAAPELENSHGGFRPIVWEDGAARVLWPIAVGEKEKKAVWGRFLKHFGAVKVDVGLGR